LIASMRTIDIPSSWILAETTVFDYIVQRTKADFPGGGVLGARADVLGIWSLMTGGGDATDTHAKCWGSLKVNGSIDGLWRDRARAQLFAGWIEQILIETENFFHTQNVQWFRATQFPAAFPVTVELPNNKSAGLVRAYQLRIPCQMVYNTSEAYEEGE